MRCTRWTALTGAIGLALAVPLALATAGPASAEVSGPCTGTIKGVDVSSRSSTNKNDAIVVGKTENVVVAASTAAGRLDRYKVQLAFAGRNWTVAKGAADGAAWTKTVNVKDYARYGVGLYKVSGVSSGGVNCTGAALVRVEGSPFSSIVGLVGAALSVIGIGAVASSGIKGFRCGPRPAAISAAAAENPVTAIVDMKTPRDYVNTVQAICTGKPAAYPPLVREICGTYLPRIRQICLWG